jgi:2-polyprenyl-3-methyl-5-hydroxy-6-metoxy-1,4-benzoquinol methylase
MDASMSTDPSTSYDHGSDPHFLEYYAQASQSPETIGRFSRVRDRAIALLAERGGARSPLDVVDIGCGAGTQTLLWAELGHRVRGLDVNAPLIAVAQARCRARGLPVTFDVGTATALPYEDESADVVLLPELLEHVDDWQRCLDEAARLVRPGGLLYLSTTNVLCPRQQEFELPLYSWYPAPLKRRYERLAVTTRPELVNHAKYPAVHWFSYYGLSRYLRSRGFNTLDRFDMLARQPLSAARRLLVTAVRRVPPLNVLAQACTGGTVVWAVRAQA